jgi:putative transposase
MTIRWYYTYALSYREIEELMLERGIKIDHATLNRWVKEKEGYWEKLVCG